MLTDQDTGDEQAAPAPPPREYPIASWLAPALRAHADGLASMYGGPIWMVGSALHLPDPGDIDLRCVLGDDDWRRLFGRSDDNGEKERTIHRRYREELKQSRRLARGFHYRFDFQFQGAAAFETKHGPRVRVDSLSDYVLGAGLGDA